MTTTEAPSLAEGILSVGDWQQWIEQEVARRQRSYANDPDEMTSAFSREQRLQRDYHGRELLEMLQNADDSGAASGQQVDSILVLSRQGLCIGNTGRPFSPRGVKSLMVSDNSP